MHTCKFCGYEWNCDHPCELSSYYDEETGTLDIQYCGNQACPACGSCQGREVDSASKANCAITRAIYERREFDWIDPTLRGLSH